MNFVTEENLVRLKVGLYGGLFFFSFFTIIAVSVTTVCRLTLTSQPMCLSFSHSFARHHGMTANFDLSPHVSWLQS